MATSTAPQSGLAGTCTVLAYRDGVLREDVAEADIDRVVANRDSIVWLDLERPTDDHFSLIAEEFQLHMLAIEDIRKAHQRPKLDEYDDSRLIVLFNAQLTPQHRRVSLHEVDIFVGPNYLITVHRFPVPAIERLRERWRQRPGLVAANPVGFLMYHLADELVDDYFPVVDTLATRIEAIEEAVFDAPDKRLLREIFTIRRDLIQLRRVLGPQRDVFNLLARRDDSSTGSPMGAYYADVVDLILRVTDTVDTLRDLLGASLESFLTVQSNSLNFVMRRLTALTITLMVPTLIAGIYGMNFQVMPELEWTYGYVWSLLLMVVAAGVTLGIFRYKDWL